ncbi:MAG: 23S rRNA (adenine2503-C2)-methyltransferase [Cellvibrionaceae bacterium]|jgi:23S rRNA (adenine2503-C2)-methyltransferase
MINLYDLTFAQLTKLLDQWGFSQFHAEKVWKGLYQYLAESVDTLPEIKPSLHKRLKAETTIGRMKPITDLASRDGDTRKFLLACEDGQSIETVIMRYEGRRDRPEETRRFTACISSQAGCAMGCVFCATGQMGFMRHLTPGEIVGQIVFVSRLLRHAGSTGSSADIAQKLRNVVLMGMGEPLHNYENTMQAIEILTDDRGLALGPRHITLSTVGLPDGIRRLADEDRLINLAVSLHGATDKERQKLVPPAKRWPLAVLLDACRYYSEKRNRRIFFEWTLIAFENDTAEQAHALGQLLIGMEAHINVIPLNPTDGYGGLPSDMQRVKDFQAVLAEYGLPSTVRQRRGIDIAAGCGQLRQREAEE